ncbi:MAG: hypothetical protein H7Z37_16880 [Pyrinomonadaceae bacterium]|nr:hypothetical protein [Pyrinomonadaceae bacterium]
MSNKLQTDVLLILLNAIAIIVVPILIVCSLIGTLFTGDTSPHKSDDEMIASFQAHKAEFETLVEMVKQDKNLKRVDGNWIDPKELETIGVSQTRIANYRNLFRATETPRGFSHYSPNSILFVGSSRGLAVSGSSKSYVIFLNGKPDKIVEDTDEYREITATELPNPQNKYPVYKHIEGNWYLEFEAN